MVIKQVPRSKIHKMMSIKDRLIPAEFYYHLHASDNEGVVKVLDWYEQRTTLVLVMEKPPNSIDLFEFPRNLNLKTINRDSKEFRTKYFTKSSKQFSKWGHLSRYEFSYRTNCNIPRISNKWRVPRGDKTSSEIENSQNDVNKNRLVQSELLLSFTCKWIWKS